jgi:hypothetical protein
MIGRAIFSRAPLVQNRLAPLSLGAVRPEGWLRQQLEAQIGLAQELPHHHRALGEDSAWLGGGGDDSALAPLYAEGLVWLAYAAGDQKLMQRAQRYLDWTLDSQGEDGWFGPASSDDWWPRIIMARTMQSYFTATGDKRALVFLDKFFRYQFLNIEEKPLRGMAVARAADNMMTALWLYNLTGMNHLLKLCHKLKAQSLDWTNHFHIFPHIRAMEKHRPWKALKQAMQNEPDGLVGASQPYFTKEYALSDAANVAAGLRAPGIVNLFKSGFKEVGAFKVGWQRLMKHHGVALGMFTGDDHLAGANPNQGVSLAALAEMMTSLETLMAVDAEDALELGDCLEKLAFNALGAMSAPDTGAHQHLTQANQPSATRAARPFYSAGEDANLFSLEGDVQDALLLGQAWPRFVSSLWYATADDGLAAASYAPCRVNFVAGGTRVRLRVKTAYPFDTQVAIEVTVKRPAEFPLYLRIPKWAEQAMIKLPDGELMALRAGETGCVRRKWMGTERVTVDLPAQPRVTRWFHQSRAVELGPLVMCLRPQEGWQKLADGALWQVTAESPWNWALIDDEAMKAVIEPDKACAFKQGADAARVLAKAVPVPDWGMEGANAAQPAIQPEVDWPRQQVLELTPFGNSSVRIAQFPGIKKSE